MGTVEVIFLLGKLIIMGLSKTDAYDILLRSLPQQFEASPCIL